jgi:hypothetical protein
MKPGLLIVVLVLTGLPQIVQARTRTIHANQTANCNRHPATVSVQGPASVTCLNPTQSLQKPGNAPASCYVTGPGVAQQVPSGGNVEVSGAGTVTLACHGSGSLTCSARIED